MPYLASEPRERGLVMDWAGEAGNCGDKVLVKWAEEMWWVVWGRQGRVNYGRMWRRRFEREDARAAKAAMAKVEARELDEVDGKERIGGEKMGAKEAKEKEEECMKAGKDGQMGSEKETTAATTWEKKGPEAEIETVTVINEALMKRLEALNKFLGIYAAGERRLNTSGALRES